MILRLAIVSFSVLLMLACNHHTETENSVLIETAVEINEPDLPEETLAKLRALSPKALPTPPQDLSNQYADDADTAALGKKFFFDPRFSGPLLHDDNNTDTSGTLGVVGQAGRVSCEGCHNAEVGFHDQRSPRGELSLAASWTRRRTPALLDVAQHKLFNWDGRRDTLYNQAIGVIENPLEFNSSRLFVAQQIARFYKTEYETIFGPLPEALNDYAALSPEEAGCTELEEGPTPNPCIKPGHDDPEILRVLVNFGKALGAYQRLLSCGTSRFDEWMHGEPDALTEEEQKGAVLFVTKGCDTCHSGPFFTDRKYYNVGIANLQNFFVEAFSDDPGAKKGLSDSEQDILNSRGIYSDGDDGRLALIDTTDPTLLGAFRTPSLRCVSRQPSFFHAAQKRSLLDAVSFFDRGGDNIGYVGEKDPAIVPLGLSSDERFQLTAFLEALDGEGPALELVEPPELPE